MLDKIYKKRINIVAQPINGDYLLVPMKDQVADMTNIYTTNRVGAFIWEQIDGTHTVREIIDLVLSKYSVDYHTAEADVKDFINELQVVFIE